MDSDVPGLPVGGLPPDPTSESAAGFIPMVWMLHGLMEAGATVFEAAAIVAAVAMHPEKKDGESEA